MTPKQFVDQYTGRVIDYDGAYGVQCVDGFKVFCEWAGIPVKATINGWANGYWIYKNELEFYKWFDYIEDVSQVKNGDWCIWDKGSSCNLSHIAMFYNGQYFGERQGGDNGFRLVSLKNDIMGALRWKGFTMLELTNGYQEIEYNGQKILAYKQYGAQDIGMVSAGTNGDTVKPIELIDDEHTHFCKINASYFQMSKTASDPYGTVYGVVESFNYSQEPKQGKFYVYYVLNNGTSSVCMDSEFWLTKADVKFAVSPAVVMIYHGTDTEMLSPAIPRSKITTANNQSLLIRLEDGAFVLAIVTGKLNLYDCRAWAKSIGAVDMIALDGGGSSQMHWGGGLYSTGRAIPNVITLYENGTAEPSTEPDDPAEEPETPDIVIDDDSDDGYLFEMSDKTYDALSFVAHMIPLFVVLYVALANTWGIPYTDKIVATISAIGVFLNSVLKQSTIGYQRAQNDKH